ncbi:hypothetical protein Dip510_000245 [Elusimicrobium posterum]|uniref:hypothetical protein n=1 Tax=Elusimicrobium posterum TaxID=3116653 RepID=UPI003C76081C
MPAVYYCAAETGKAAVQIIQNFKLAFYFLGGGFFYLIIHFCLYDFSRFYVASHELTHAVAALLFGFKVKSVKINKRSGHVKVDKYNDAVVLSPYITPFYFLISAAIIYICLRNGYDTVVHKNLYALVLGFFFFFHVTHTILTITETKQPDLVLAGGSFYSILLIILINILLLMFLIGFIFPQILPLGTILKNIFWDWLYWWQKVLHYIMKYAVELLKL